MVSYKELLGFVWHFIRQQKWIFLAIFLLDIFAWPLETIIWPYFLHIVVDTFTAYEGDRSAAWGVLKNTIIGAVCLVIYIEAASRTMGFLMAKAIPTLQASIRTAMFNHIQRHSPHYFNERFAGSLANKMTDMTTQVELIIQQFYWPIFPAIAGCIFASLVFWSMSPILTGILLLWIAIHLTVTLTFSRSCDHFEHLHGEARSTLLGGIVDSFTNNFAVNLFYRFKQEQKTIAVLQKEEADTNRKAKKHVEKMRLVTSIFYFALCFVGMNGFLIYLWVHHHITTGQAVQIFNTVGHIAAIMWMMGSALPILFQSFGTAKQAYSVMRDVQDIADEPNAQPLQITSGAISFDNVSFRYGEQNLFKNKHVQIRGGEKLGLVGFTGAGKSTFINLILRFFHVHDGSILIDGQNIAKVTLESLRSQIALIPQDPILFHRSLRENICYGKPEATEAEMIHAAKLSHCDEFIQRIPRGYEAKVGERGTKLSGGEKQRIAIARAILVNAPILILDEATSALDSVTEGYIQDSLDALMRGRTTIAIAHRLSTLSRMDRILVFDKGKIVEEGSHIVLLEQKGLYAQMWNMQVGGYLPEARGQ